MTISVTVQRRAGCDPAIPLPAYETAGAAGMDVHANFPDHWRAGITLEPQTRALIPTGLALGIPQGYEIQVRPRSGLAFKHGVTIANAPGTIDSDYRGELGILLINLGPEPFTITHGDRIAQLVLAPVIRCEWAEVTNIDSTIRSTGGFGSTGT